MIKILLTVPGTMDRTVPYFFLTFSWNNSYFCFDVLLNTNFIAHNQNMKMCKFNHFVFRFPREHDEVHHIHNIKKITKYNLFRKKYN